MPARTHERNTKSPADAADGIDFCDIQKGPSVRNFAKEAPDWRRLGPGLAYEGRCINDQCVAYNKEVYINRGYGHFDIARDVHRHANCPMCDHSCSEVHNCAFYHARWSFCGLPNKTHYGIILQEVGNTQQVSYSKKAPVEVVTRGISNVPGTFCKFDTAVNSLTTWAYLSVIVTPPLSLPSSNLSDEDDWVDVVDMDTGQCPVCLENMLYNSLMKLSCSHCLCPTCFKKVNKCPLCRANILKAKGS